MLCMLFEINYLNRFGKRCFLTVQVVYNTLDYLSKSRKSAISIIILMSGVVLYLVDFIGPIKLNTEMIGVGADWRVRHVDAEQDR